MKFKDLKVGSKIYIDATGYGLLSVLKLGVAGFHTEKGYINYSCSWIDWEKTAELNDFNDNEVELNGIKAREAFIDESDHIALIENRGGGGQYEEVMTCHAHIMKSFKDKPISDVRLATMSMIAHKMARLACGYGDDDDNLKDIAGYAELERITLKGDLK